MATDYLDLAKQAYDASTAYLTTNHQSDWDYSLRAFRNEHAAGSKYNSEEFKARSRIFRPKTRTIIRKNEAAAMQAAFSNNEMVQTEAGNPMNVMSLANADALKALMHYRLRHTIPTYQVYLGGVQDAQTTGAVCSHQYWEYEKRADGRKIKDRPCIDLRPIENIRIDMAASWIDPVGTSPYFCDIIPMYVCDVKAMMKNKDEKTNAPKWKSFDDAIIQRARPDTMDAMMKARLSGQKQDPADETKIRAFDIVWVMRWFMKDSQGADQCFYTLGTEDLLTKVKPIEDVYFHGKRPYVIGYAVLETHKVLKSSVPLLIKQLQMETNDVANQRLDNVKFVLNKRWLVARGRQADVQSLIRNVPGGVTMTTDPKNDIVESNWADVTSSSYVEQDRLSADLDDMAGNFSPSTKVANNAVNDTLGGSKMAAAGAGLMTEYLIHTINQTWWEPVLSQLGLLERYYETDEVILTICAEQAKLFEKFGISRINDALLMEEVTVSVDMAMGDPNQRLQKFLFATNAAIQLVNTAPPSFNIQEITKEIYANSGYRSGSRFVNNQQDPRLVKAMQMIQQLQSALQGKGMELQASMQETQLKLASDERIKGAEIQVNAQRIQGDLQIRQSELAVEVQRLELEKLKIQAEIQGQSEEMSLRIAEMQAKVAESERKLLHEKEKFAMQMAANHDATVKEVEKMIVTHQIKVAGMLEVEDAKRKSKAMEGDAAARDADNTAAERRREASDEINKSLVDALAQLAAKSNGPKTIELIKRDGETVGAKVS